MSELDSYLHRFAADVSHIELPSEFTFPFYYTPHPLVEAAAVQLQQYLMEQEDWSHNFGILPNRSGNPVGKMFGILVVKTEDGELRFLTAFSGKMAESYQLPGFVPPIFDLLDESGFYKKEESVINNLNALIEELESNEDYIQEKETLAAKEEKLAEELAIAKGDFAKARKVRRKERKTAEIELSEADYKLLHIEHQKASYHQQKRLREMAEEHEHILQSQRNKVATYQDQIDAYKQERKERSNALQQRLFAQYDFLNINGEKQNVKELFVNTLPGVPPAGAGDCAAPKLLQYAFEHGLEPICIGEFWWGKGPTSEVRKHGYFYPACRGKCEPILGHMLSGINVEPNPMEATDFQDKHVEILYEDDLIAIVNKPHEMLSVPGKTIMDSVYTRMQARYRRATGPLLVHRLDMSTSGIMLIAKTKRAHKYLQEQFINRTISKRYSAILDGLLKGQEGEINLPLRVDLNDRPRQLVCETYGKPAVTRYEVEGYIEKYTQIRFYPVTGRTHQLRVHAAHSRGLDMPILGDDLYGRTADRLYLHAAYIRFRHPRDEEWVEFSCPSGFEERLRSQERY